MQDEARHGDIGYRLSNESMEPQMTPVYVSESPLKLTQSTRLKQIGSRATVVFPTAGRRNKPKMGRLPGTEWYSSRLTHKA